MDLFFKTTRNLNVHDVERIVCDDGINGYIIKDVEYIGTGQE